MKIEFDGVSRRSLLMQGGALGVAAFAARFGFAVSQAERETLAAAARHRHLLFGSPIFPNDLDVPGYEKLLLDQSSIITNTVYASVTQPTPDTWNLTGFSAVRDVARSNRKVMRGHPLVWHQAIPAWMNNLDSADAAKKCIEDRIHKLVGMYPGEFQSWDVVNEAIDTNSKLDGSLTDCVWSKLLGQEYLDLAFHTAHSVDKHAVLNYNDFGTEGDDEGSLKKRDAIYAMLKGMIDRGVPVKSFGLQSHISVGQTFETLPDWIKKVHDLGLEVFLTELDVTEHLKTADIPTRDKAIAGAYTDFLTQALAPGIVKVVECWGLANNHSWLQTFPYAIRADKVPLRPLPFDDDFKPTPAFEAMERVFLK